MEPGTRVALVSPSGPLSGSHELGQALAAAAGFGWNVSVGTYALSRMDCFAGEDEARAEDLVGALDDESVDAIWCLRGGYGASRLLPLVWPAVARMAVRERPQALIGYSDVTALHAAWQQAGLMSYHGPTARSPLTPFTRLWFEAAVLSTQNPVLRLQAPDSICIVPGTATGRLAGGNLAVLASLSGTPWAMDFRDAIVVLEDVDEATYRLDRMLLQLLLAGALDGCVGIAFGQFTRCNESTSDGERPLASIVREVAESLQVPTLHGIPVGHIEDQWTLPLGALTTIDTHARTLTVQRHQ